MGTFDKLQPIEYRLGKSGSTIRQWLPGVYEEPGLDGAHLVRTRRGLLVSVARKDVRDPKTRDARRAGKLIRRNERIARERQPLRSVAYLNYVRQQSCMFCSAPPPSEAHHYGSRGVGQKADDRETVPLCHSCHTHWHNGHWSLLRTGASRALIVKEFLAQQLSLQSHYKQGMR